MILSSIVFPKLSLSFVLQRAASGRQLKMNTLSAARSGSITRSPLRTVTSSQKRFSTHLHETQKLELEIATIEDMEDVGAVLSVGTKGGDVLVLDGDLGAGKTCFSRGFVRARTGFTDMRVTSPTYLLSNTYPANDDDDDNDDDLLIHHMDLYRLSEGSPEDLEPLNLDFVLNHCISLIEWSSRLGKMMPPERLEITFKIDPDTMEEEENTRYLTIIPHGEKWIKCIETIKKEGYLDDLIVEYEEE